LGNIPLNGMGTWTFSYQGDSIKPQSMNLLSYNDYRVYFFYNADGSKNKDSMVSSIDPSVQAVRKYAYDSAFNYQWQRTTITAALNCHSKIL
jgi:hypothetical protein